MAFSAVELVHIRIFQRIDGLRLAGQRGHHISSLNAPSVVDRLMNPANKILTEIEVAYVHHQVGGTISTLFWAGSAPKIAKPLHEALIAEMCKRVSRYVLYPGEHRIERVPRGFGVVAELAPSEQVAACLRLAARLCVERSIIQAALRQANAGLQPQ